METPTASPIRAAALASAALAFAGIGDAFLYPFLPLNGSVVGLSATGVGVLLSINRFVRIFSNAMMVHLLARYGPRTVIIAGAMLSIFSTLGYTIAYGLLTWLLFRICWGIAFSAMRIGTLAYALESSPQGFALGVSRSLQETGPLIALFFAPFLLGWSDAGMTFFLLALLSLPALYFAYRLPRKEDSAIILKRIAFVTVPSRLNAITFLSSVLIDGILVVVLGVLFLEHGDHVSVVTATSLAAIYLGYRRMCLVVLSPAGGWIGDRLGLERTFIVSLALVVGGLFVLISGYVATGSLIVFTFYSINSAITPGAVSRDQSHSLSAVAENATWRDIGAAVGTLAGGILISSRHLIDILFIAIFALVILLFIHLRSAQNVLKIYLWK